MRILVQRVSSAQVLVAAEVVGSIGVGLLVFVGVRTGDDAVVADKAADKVANLRILRDGDRDESSVSAVGGEVLVVSQFTLYGDARTGRRPSWVAAAGADVAEPLVEAVVAGLRKRGISVSTGRFGAQMLVQSVNDGPMTVLVDLDPDH
ncbi:D-aminoacyl-tRNA deacylase [Jatrophihabitans telluris]|uniref:D-aminoacyl-tRNA deacylase n=1 Tax=Jatrophihabitans telluris TaxID=2038343 RepID=A0ABY4QSA6_9ACTN|nr:D-aminoacyl-tRNA deacylase [Jatrophihabitans telluris]UQX86719.1 D-aminoacyl-tRNA deacylase [Jatrophihabitans telluris]